MNKIILTIFLALSICACNYSNKCNDFEKSIWSICEDSEKRYSIVANGLVDFEWQKLYVISGPRFSGEVRDIVGVSYSKLVQDGERLYLFVLDGEIVKEMNSSCREIDYSLNVLKDRGYVLVDSKAVIEAKRLNSEGNEFVRIISIGN